jgi:amino acid adenylation domain-containing protein
VTELLEQTTARWPDKLAVDDGEYRLTYSELDAQGNALAAQLMDEGLAVQDRVAILCERGIAGVVAIISTLKAGAIYVPLDPHNPEIRLRQILDDIQPAVVIGARQKLNAKVAGGVYSIALEDLTAAIVSNATGGIDRAVRAPQRCAEERDVAYCMYTSGSTGEPRGVEIEHRSLLAFIRAFDAYMRFDEDCRCLSTSPYYFDVSASDLLMPLVLGATVYMVRSVLPPSRVLERIETARITHFCPPAPLLTLLCGPGSTFERRDLASLRCIMTGAEVIARPVVAKWLNKVPGVRILNAYGPTEATCACMAHEITSKNFADYGELPIGRPFEGIDLHLLDPDGLPDPNLTTGELAIAGTQVMRGYWNRPAETAARILDAERRYYKSGDLCEVDQQGQYYFRGRKDNEIKLRGYRVNLDEIRRALLHDDRLSQAVAGILNLKSGQASLGVAVVLRAPGTLAVLEDVVSSLSQRLPTYMLPEYGLICDSFPSLPSGKTDTRRTIELLADGVNAHASRWFKLDRGILEPLA